MAELLLDCLGIRAESADKDEKKPKLKKRRVTGILEWVQYYCIYTAVILAKYPERNQDMLGYMALIVEACMEYEGDSWLGYDCRFRQMVTATPGATWAKIDPILWNMAFTGQARARRCKHCFNLTHLDCSSSAQGNCMTHAPKIIALRQWDPVQSLELRPYSIINTSHTYICSDFHKIIYKPSLVPRPHPLEGVWSGHETTISLAHSRYEMNDFISLIH